MRTNQRRARAEPRGYIIGGNMWQKWDRDVTAREWSLISAQLLAVQREIPFLRMHFGPKIHDSRRNSSDCARLIGNLKVAAFPRLDKRQVSYYDPGHSARSLAAPAARIFLATFSRHCARADTEFH